MNTSFTSKLIVVLALMFPLLANSAILADDEFVGSKKCENCHSQEFKNWQGSHHDLAMQLPTSTSVLGDFNNAIFTYNGADTTFYKRADKYFVHTDGEDGVLTEFPVDYVFGVYPLQQYLLPLSGGRCPRGAVRTSRFSCGSAPHASWGPTTW